MWSPNQRLEISRLAFGQQRSCIEMNVRSNRNATCLGNAPTKTWRVAIALQVKTIMMNCLTYFVFVTKLISVKLIDLPISCA